MMLNMISVRIGLRKKRAKGITWEELLFACKGDDRGLEIFLETKKEDDDWPEALSAVMWKDLIAELEDAEKRRIVLGHNAIIVAKPNEINCVVAPEEDRTSWQLYKNHLKKNDFSDEAIDNIEESCVKILKQIKRIT